MQLQPESEHAPRRVMRLHYLRGGRATVLAAFDRCVDALRRALDVVPGAETRALRVTIEASVALRPIAIPALWPKSFSLADTPQAAALSVKSTRATRNSGAARHETGRRTRPPGARASAPSMQH